MHKLLINIWLWTTNFFYPLADIEFRTFPHVAHKLEGIIRQTPSIPLELAAQLLNLKPFQLKEAIFSGKIDLPFLSSGEGEGEPSPGGEIPTASVAHWLIKCKKAKKYGNTEAFYSAMGGIDNVRRFFKQKISQKSRFRNEQIGRVLFKANMAFLTTLAQVDHVRKKHPQVFGIFHPICKRKTSDEVILFSEAAKKIGISEKMLLQQIVTARWPIKFVRNLEQNGTLLLKTDVEKLITKYKKLFEEIGFWLIIVVFVWLEFFSK